MKTNTFLLILIAVGFIACQSGINLKSDKLLVEIFTKSELKEIDKMIRYVDAKVLNNTGNNDINSAYHQYLDKMNHTIQDSSKFLVPFEEEEKYQFFESMDSIVFNEFWRLSKGVKAVRYKDSVYYNVENYKKLKLKPVGRYFDYMKKLGEDDEFFKSVHEAMEVAGDLSAGTAVTFPMKHQDFDFTVPKNRLWGAVFLLRIEEHSDKKMERYLTGKKHPSNNL